MQTIKIIHKMKYSGFSIYMILLSFLGACSHINQSEMQVQHIPINLEKNKVLNLSSFCDSIEIVPLQTTEENLIGEIGRIIYSNGKVTRR